MAGLPVFVSKGERNTFAEAVAAPTILNLIHRALWLQLVVMASSAAAGCPPLQSSCLLEHTWRTDKELGYPRNGYPFSTTS